MSSNLIRFGVSKLEPQRWKARILTAFNIHACAQVFILFLYTWLCRVAIKKDATKLAANTHLDTKHWKSNLIINY